ncbi:MAG: hypothetical protein ACK58T_27460, partial [Phycisphaerae bacterium]
MAQMQSDLVSRESVTEDFMGPQSAAEDRGDQYGFENDAVYGSRSESVAVGPIARHEVFGPRALMRLLAPHEDAS